MKLKKFIPFCFLFIGTLALPQPSLTEEKIEVIPIIKSSILIQIEQITEKYYLFMAVGIPTTDTTPT